MTENENINLNKINDKRFRLHGNVIYDCIDNFLFKVEMDGGDEDSVFADPMGVLHHFNELCGDINMYSKIVNCGNCKHHGYDWYDDGDEFEVCDKNTSYHIERLVNHYFCEDWEKQYEELQRLKEENEELRERNNRQTKQLQNLYDLIRKQDWKTLNRIIEEFRECEEQLQKEWKVYE